MTAVACPRCASPLAPGHRFCPICGAPLTSSIVSPLPASAAPPVHVDLRRPGVVTLLAVLQFLGAAAMLLLGAVFFVAVAADGSDAVPLSVAGGILLGIGLLQAVCGVGLWTLKPYGRVLQLVLAVIGLLAFPLGTVVAILVLVYLNKPGVKVLFSGRAADSLTQEEAIQVHAVTSTSTGMVVALALLIAFGGVFMVAIVAAIAVPGLLRARMTANESSAIGLLASTSGAQVEYASTCGRGAYATSYAALLETISAPAESPLADLNRTPAQKFGYAFSLEPGAAGLPGPLDCRGRETTTSWYATAVPQTYGTTGTRSFAATADGVWADSSAVAPIEPFDPPAIRIR